MARIFHVSDLHFGRQDQGALDWFADVVKAERPDAVIITGDLTFRARRSEYEDATAWLAALDVPITIEPGNHDLPYFNPFARFIDPYRRYRRLERVIEDPIDLAGVAIVPLRTTSRAQWRTNWSWGVVRPRRLKRTLAMLGDTPENRVRIVACHHPLIDSAAMTKRSRTQGGNAALTALAQAGADAVLSGHVHDPFDVPHHVGGRTIRLIGAGTLSERVRETAPSFNLITVENGKIAVEVRVMPHSGAPVPQDGAHRVSELA